MITQHHPVVKQYHTSFIRSKKPFTAQKFTYPCILYKYFSL